MPEIFPNILGGGLEIWASIYCKLHIAYNIIKYIKGSVSQNSTFQKETKAVK